MKAITCALLGSLALLASGCAPTIIVQSSDGLYSLGNNGAVSRINSASVQGLGVAPDGKQIVFSPTLIPGNSDSGDVVVENLGDKSTQDIYDAETQGEFSDVRYTPNGKEIIGSNRGEIWA